MKQKIKCKVFRVGGKNHKKKNIYIENKKRVSEVFD